MRKALFAGSFNPFTVGHADIVKRGLELFDEVVIAIGENQDKPSADIHERLQAIRDVYKGEPRVQVEVYHSLTVDFAQPCVGRHRDRGAVLPSGIGVCQFVAGTRPEETWCRHQRLTGKTATLKE